VNRRLALLRLSPRAAAILVLLCEAGDPLSTTKVRERINRGRDHGLVAEQVYRALVGLQQAGLVRRVHVAGSRKAFWEAAIDLTAEEAS
jgi:Fe2+ or Zn2+ uptake regulation protein